MKDDHTIRSAANPRADFNRAASGILPPENDGGPNRKSSSPRQITPEFNQAAGKQHVNPDRPQMTHDREPSLADKKAGGEYGRLCPERLQKMQQSLQNQARQPRDPSLSR